MRYSNTPAPTPLTLEKFPSSSRRSAVVTFAAAVASRLRNHAANGLEPARSRYSRTVNVHMVTDTLPLSSPGHVGLELSILALNRTFGNVAQRQTPALR